MKNNRNKRAAVSKFWQSVQNSVCMVLLLSLLVIPAAAQDRGVNVKPVSGQVSEKRIALVIGNSSYQHADSLGNPANDAADMAQALRDLGFEVFSGTNQTKAQMQNLIRQFGNRLTDTKAVGLFFYAGHGISAGGTNYLVPVDADIQAEDEIEDSSVSINFLLGKMSSADNGFNMVILDACRNNPFAKKWRNYRDLGDKGGLARIDAPTGTLIAYATKPGDVAADGDGRNGLYTGALLKQMRVKNLDVTKMLQYVRADVMRQSGGRQVPFDESSLVGDFSFAGSVTSIVSNQPVEPIKTGQDIAAQEQQAWGFVKNSTDAEDFRLFLKEFPNGANTASARIRLRQLDASAAAKNPPPQSSGSSEASNKQSEIAAINDKNEKVKNINDTVNKAISEGNLAFNAKNYDLAIDKYTEGYNADPEFLGSAPSFLNNRATALKIRAIENYKKGQANPAVKVTIMESVKKDLLQSVDDFQKSLALLKTASDAVLQKQYDASKKVAIGGLVESYRLLIATCMDTTHTKEAIVASEQYAVLETNVAEKFRMQLLLATALRESGDSDNAIPVYRKALESSPDNVDAIGGLGLSLFAVGVANENKEQKQEGVNLMQKFIDTAPDSNPMKKDIEGAINYLKNTEKLTPKRI